jgi:hypothetical protein
VNDSEAASRRRQAFIKLAEARMSKALKLIRLIGNLSNRSNYEYTEEDVQKIVRALESEVKDLRGRFAMTDSKAQPEFKL